MKIKVGNKIYDSKKTIVAIALSEDEKAHIGAMGAEANKFCAYPRDTLATVIDEFLHDEFLD